MKTRTLLAATLAATLALAGCSKNDEPDGPTRAAVNIRTSIGGTIDAGNFGRPCRHQRGRQRKL